MIERIFPARFDNEYRGNRLGLWLFGLLVFMRLMMGANMMLNTRSVAVGADSIPLDSYGPGGAAMVLALFASAGLSRFVLALLGLVALIRYRSMVPFLFLLLLAEQAGYRLLALATGPVASSQTATIINLFTLSLLILGLAISVLPGRARADGSRG